MTSLTLWVYIEEADRFHGLHLVQECLIWETGKVLQSIVFMLEVNSWLIRATTFPSNFCKGR